MKKLNNVLILGAALLMGFIGSAGAGMVDAHGGKNTICPDTTNSNNGGTCSGHGAP